jgi:hypothetical protein
VSGFSEWALDAMVRTSIAGGPANLAKMAFFHARDVAEHTW